MAADGQRGLDDLNFNELRLALIVDGLMTNGRELFTLRVI